jgi:hypothetical protein
MIVDAAGYLPERTGQSGQVSFETASVLASLETSGIARDAGSRVLAGPTERQAPKNAVSSTRI